jgi:hypothetical protein
MNNHDLPVRHKRQMPFPVDDNNTVMGKIGGSEQLSLFPGGGDDDAGVAADPFDFQPDRVYEKFIFKTNNLILFFFRKKLLMIIGIQLVHLFQ